MNILFTWGYALIPCQRNLGLWVWIWLWQSLIPSLHFSYVGMKMRTSPVTCCDISYRKLGLKNWLGDSGEVNFKCWTALSLCPWCPRRTWRQLKTEVCLRRGRTWAWGRKSRRHRHPAWSWGHHTPSCRSEREVTAFSRSWLELGSVYNGQCQVLLLDF